MSQLANLNLKQPEKVDWANFNPASKWNPPPPALDATGNAIVYSGTLPKEFKVEEDKDGFLQFLIDPITMASGQTIRFVRASVKLFQRGEKTINANKVGTLLRSAGIAAKPQTNEEYVAAMTAAAGRKVHFTIDWNAYNKDNQESVSGYTSFPEDPERPGQRKAILKAGDVVTIRDFKGNIVETKTIVSEVLFANPQVRYFVDPTQKR